MICIGSFVIFLGGFVGIVLSVLNQMKYSIPCQWVMVDIATSLYVLGGLMYIIGGCALAQAYNKSGLYSTSYAGTWFGEAVFVGLHAIIAGV